MMGIFAAYIIISIKIIGFSQHLDDLEIMTPLGYQWRDISKLEYGFHKKIGSHDVYINFHHGSNQRGLEEAAVYVNVLSEINELNLENYFCNKVRLNDFIKNAWFGGNGNFSPLANGHSIGECYHRKIESSIINLPQKSHNFTGWSGMQSFMPAKSIDAGYYVSLQRRSIDINSIDREIINFISYYDVLIKSNPSYR